MYLGTNKVFQKGRGILFKHSCARYQASLFAADRLSNNIHNIAFKYHERVVFLVCLEYSSISGSQRLFHQGLVGGTDNPVLADSWDSADEKNVFSDGKETIKKPVSPSQETEDICNVLKEIMSSQRSIVTPTYPFQNLLNQLV